MPPIYIPTRSPEDWRQFLAEPEKQWRKGYSARELAERWEGSHGFPAEVKALFATATDPAMRAPELLLAIPEYQVPLPPANGHPSQNDLFVLARNGEGDLMVIMVEGKVAESFGPTLADWQIEDTPGKRERLAFLLETLRMPAGIPPTIRYQLLHRTASAILTARRFNARHAVMLVHSFSPEHAWLEDYQAFLGLFGARAGIGELVAIPGHDFPLLHTGWVAG